MGYTLWMHVSLWSVSCVTVECVVCHCGMCQVVTVECGHDLNNYIKQFDILHLRKKRKYKCINRITLYYSPLYHFCRINHAASACCSCRLLAVGTRKSSWIRESILNHAAINFKWSTIGYSGISTCPSFRHRGLHPDRPPPKRITQAAAHNCCNRM